MDLNEIVVFARVVQAGSFIGASRTLGMPKSTVSRRISELEARLGARLLHRTTRKLRLTEVGHTYYVYAARVVTDVEEAELAVSRMQDAPRGLLRVTAPLNFGYLGPIVASFLVRYPEVQVEVVCADRVVDLVLEGFDVAVRAGELRDSTLIARSLGTLESVVVASPELLEAHGIPEQPEDLARIDCLVFGTGGDGVRWRLRRGGVERVVEVRPRLTVNDFELLADAARAGLGVAMLQPFRVVDDLASGRLRRVLPDWCSPTNPLHAIYPSTRHLSPKVKAFIDHLRDAMIPPPWERTDAAEPATEA